MKKKEGEYVQLLNKRFCLECGDLIYGRSDRKFCSEKCRYTHHNNQFRPSRLGRTKVLRALDRNYAILKGLLEQGVQEISIVQICELGFSPTNMTSMVKKSHYTECGVFDIMYRLTESKLSNIRKSSLYLPLKPRER